MNAIEQIQAILDFLLLVKTGLFSDVAKNSWSSFVTVLKLFISIKSNPTISQVVVCKNDQF